MVKIEAIVQPFKLDAVKAALDDLGVEGVTISHVMDHSGPLGLKTTYRGSQYHVDTARVKLEMLVSSRHSENVIDALLEAARTGTSCDDGAIWVCEVADAMRIRNGRRIQFAMS